MRVKQTAKRLFAVGAGVAMLGATAMGALATDLSHYPSMFVEDGVFNGYLVVGESAQPIDNIAMTDIATGMMVGEGGSVVSLDGDAWLAESSGNFLELGEAISSVEGYITDGDLAALGDGEISNSKGTSDYEQFLYFDENDGTVTYQEDEDDNVGYFYKISNGDVIARYLLDFGDTLDSDIIAATQKLDDIEDKKIVVLGKEYTITTAENTTNGVKLVFMGGASSGVLHEGESATYTVNGVDYDVELLSVSNDGTNDEVQFAVNGELTNKLQDGESDVLNDGTNIGVTEITYQNYAGGIHSAAFFVGSDKIELENGQSMKVNEETISEATVTITSSESSGDIAIDSIQVNMTADDDLYVGVGGKLSEAPDFDEPEVMFTRNWDIELTDVHKLAGEDVALTFSESDDQADLKVMLYDGEASISLAYHNGSTTAYAGEDNDERFVFNVSGAITDEDHFILNTANPDSATSDARSYYLQYKGADDVSETNPKARVRNMVTGEVYERSLTASSGNYVFDLKLGGTTFNFQNATSGASDDFSIKRTSGGSLGYSVYDTTGHKLLFRSKGNHEIWFIQNNASLASGAYQVAVNVDDTDLFDDSVDAGLVVLNTSITVGTDELATSSQTISGTAISDPGDSDVSTASSAFGELLTITAPDSGPSKYELSLPSSQAEVKLYVSSGAVASNSVATGDLVPVRFVDATKLDSEIASPTAQNLIVVGGPCVNSVAAELLGNPSDCTEGFTPGVARVKLWEHANGNMAMLVAGFTGEDTRLAGQFLAHRWTELSGDEVEIEGTTYADASVGAPSPVMMEEDSSMDDGTGEE